MKQTNKRIISLLLVALMLLGIVGDVIPALPVSAAIVKRPIAQQIETISRQPGDYTVLSQSSTRSVADQDQEALEEAADALRDGMKTRDNEITIDVFLQEADPSEAWTQVWNMAMEHTGDPKEGDYLAWHWSAYGGGISGYSSAEGMYLTFTYTVSYYTDATQETALDAAVEDLLEELDLWDATDYEKVCGIYDYMCQNIAYDHMNLEDETYTLKYSAYAALVNETAVCQGYALLFYRLALSLDVDARFIGGTGNGGGHAWNIVKLDNQYYNLDATWDRSWYEAGLPYEWFLRSNENFPDHQPDPKYLTAEFLAAYPISETDYDPDDASGEEGVIASGTCGENLTWVLTEDGMLTISGSGGMDHYNDGDNQAPWADYREQILGVVLDGDISIGGYAFWSCENMVTFQSSHPWIVEEGSFQNCKSLKTVTIYGFADHAMASFDGCGSLEEVALEEGVTEIPMDTFNGCSSLRVVRFPKSLEFIGPWAFTGCALTELILPEGVTYIGDMAFTGCGSLQTVVLPKSLTELSFGVFDSCGSLETVFIQSAEMAEYAKKDTDEADFFDQIGFRCAATLCFAPDITFDAEYFAEIRSCMSEMEYEGVTYAAYSYHVKGEVLGQKEADCESGYTTYLCETCGESFRDDYTEPNHQFVSGVCELCGEIERLASGDCGDGVKWVLTADGVLTISGTGDMDIGWRAPWENWSDSITSVVIEDGVASIDKGTFHYLSNLTGIWVSADHPNYSSDDYGVLFNKDKTVLLRAPRGLSGAYIVPDGVTRIEDDAFVRCEGLTGITIATTVSEIGSSVFEGCDGLTEITIPAGVLSMEISAVRHCVNLVGIWVDTDNPNYSSDDYGVLFNKDKTTLLQAPKGLDGAYMIPSSVTKIEGEAFQECKGLSEITIPNSVCEIGGSAFQGCVGLTRVTIPDSVTWMEHGVFMDCTGLTRVTIGSGIHELFPEVFANCTSLNEVYFEGDAPDPFEEAFGGVIATAYYPAGNDTWTEDVMQDYGGTITWTSWKVIYDLPEDDSVTIPENDCFEDGTTVTIEEILTGDLFEQVAEVMEQVAETYVAFEFTATKGEENVQPNGNLLVTFAIPEGYSDNIAVYYMADDGTLEVLLSNVDTENRTVSVELTHFSTYIVVDLDTKVALKGDLDLDGDVDAEDLTILARHVAGIELLTDATALANADVNGDDSIDANDLTMHARFVAGIINAWSDEN